MRLPEWLPDTCRPTRPEHGPRRPLIGRMVQPLARFQHVEAADGLVLLACTGIDLVRANAPWAASFAEFRQTRIGFSAPDGESSMKIIGHSPVFYCWPGWRVLPLAPRNSIERARNASAYARTSDAVTH